MCEVVRKKYNVDLKMDKLVCRNMEEGLVRVASEVLLLLRPNKLEAITFFVAGQDTNDVHAPATFSLFLYFAHIKYNTLPLRQSQPIMC